MMDFLKVFTISNNFQKYSIAFIYLFVNALFIFKYGGEYNIFILAFYFIFVLAFAKFYIKVNLNKSLYKWSFLILIVLSFLGIVGLNYFVDGYSLNVDRWSAMEVGINAILNNEYPYNIKDHMGRESSNLPILIILGAPFYLLFGSVGYLQAFCFLIFAYIFFRVLENYKQRLFALIILIISPGYIYEIYVKSDLFSNFIVMAGISYLIWSQFIIKKNIKIHSLSVMTVFILLTRLSVIIPCIILLFKPFIELPLKQKIIFVAVFAVTVFVILFLFFHNAHDFEMIAKHNPFNLQGGKQPLVLSISLIIISCNLSFKVNSFLEVAFWSGFLLFIAAFITFILYLIDFGFENVMVNSFFDLSFFNMSMPFIILTIILAYKNKSVTQR